MGLTMAWLYEQLLAKFVLTEFGSLEQQETILPKLGQGNLIINLAVSEPQAGAHPKYLQTVAQPTAAGYLLTGEKSYLTLGPIADLFIVLAKTGQQEQTNLFSAFLVPKDSPGLSLQDPLRLPFLKTCPHCGLKLDQVFVQENNILGPKDQAWGQLVMPFAQKEEILLIGMLSGALELELELVFRPQTAPHPQLGELLCILQGLNALGFKKAQQLDQRGTQDRQEGLVLLCKKLIQDFQKTFKNYLQNPVNNPHPLAQDLCQEIDWVSRLGEKRVKKRKEKLAAQWLTHKGQPVGN